MAIACSDTKTFGVTNTDSPHANISKFRVQHSRTCDFILAAVSLKHPPGGDY